MFWKRTTGAAAVAGLITGLVMAIFFNNFAVSVFGNETWLYTAFRTLENGKEIFQIPFLINMGWSFFFTVLIMVGFSIAGPKINPKAFELDKAMFKLSPSIIGMIVITLLILTVLYAKFW
jgi:SSS family solute:Na+ symporter